MTMNEKTKDLIKNRKSQQRNLRYKEEPNANVRTENYNQNKKLSKWDPQHNGDNRR